MPAVTPNPAAIRAFKDEAALEAWLKTNHQRQPELFLRIFKKDSGKPTITYAQALDVALCWGWIDGVRKPYDEQSFLQRFTPRKPKSRWSQINRQHVARLTRAGRMTEFGQRQIDAAKADGRWDAAYASQRQMQTPPDLLAAIEAEPKALALFQTLNRQNLYALAYRTQHVTTQAGRERKIRDLVAMLKRGETPHPNIGRKSATPRDVTPAKRTGRKTKTAIDEKLSAPAGSQTRSPKRMARVDAGDVTTGRQARASAKTIGHVGGTKKATRGKETRQGKTPERS